jgi:hypothetical protein
VAGWLLWLLVVIVIVAAVIGLLLLGPFGLAIAVPVAILMFLVYGSTSSGPATGARGPRWGGHDGPFDRRAAP